MTHRPSAKLYRSLVKKGWRYTGCEGYVIVPDSEREAPPGGCVPVYQRCGADGSAVLATGDEVPLEEGPRPREPDAVKVGASGASGSGSARNRGANATAGSGLDPASNKGSSASAASAAVASAPVNATGGTIDLTKSRAAPLVGTPAAPDAEPKFKAKLADGSRLLGFIPTSRHPDHAGCYSELREYRHIATGTLYYTTRSSEWDWISQRTPKQAGFNPIRGIVLGIDKTGRSLVAPESGDVERTGAAKELYDSMTRSANDGGESGWELVRSLGFISVEERYDVALVLRNDRASAGELKKREKAANAAARKQAAAAAAANARGETGGGAAGKTSARRSNRIFPEVRIGERDAPSALSSVKTVPEGTAAKRAAAAAAAAQAAQAGGASLAPSSFSTSSTSSSSHPSPHPPAPPLPADESASGLKSPRPLSASSRVHASRYVDLFVAERSELIRCIAQKGFSVRVVFSSDGQDVHVMITLPPRLMELMLQDMGVNIAQGTGFGFAPYSFRHRTDFAGYQNRDPRYPYQMPCPAVRLRAVMHALERRAFPFGFYHEKWFRKDKFYPLEDPSRPEEPVHEPGRPNKVIDIEDRDYISLSDAVEIGIVSETVNMRDDRLKDELEAGWARAVFHRQPLAKVREYFGGRIAFYFAWLGFYNVWLIAPSILGLGVFVHQLARGSIIVSTLPFFCLFMALWSVFFLESWVRRESVLAHEWGLLSFEDTETERIEFRGRRMMHPTIPGHVINYYPRWKRGIKHAIGMPVLTLFLGVVIAFIVGSIEFRAAYTFSCGSVTGCESYVASLATAIFVIIMNAIYARVALALTNWENHRTESAYSENLIAKTFAFQFANAFAALFHLGLYEMDLETLRLQLFMNLFVKQIVFNVQELLVPHIFYRRARAAERKEAVAAKQAGHPMPELTELGACMVFFLHIFKFPNLSTLTVFAHTPSSFIVYFACFFF
jgi:hypothetical protein